MRKNKKLTKGQIKGLIESKRKIIRLITIITLISIWIKVGLNTNWHFSDITLESIVLFILLLMGILSNVRNDFPIFNSRKYKITEEFSYSVTLFFSILFIFIVYKNIVEPDFVSYIAGLSFHDLCTLLVFLLPVALLIIEIINLSFKIIGKKTKIKNEIKIYDEETERVLNRYKVLTIKTILIVILLSIWIKVGLNNSFDYIDILYELVTLLMVVFKFMISNIKNKLPVLYSFNFKIDIYFIGSLLLPYLLIFIYALVNVDFRFLLLSLDTKYLISFIVYIAPIFLIPSVLFYVGLKYPNIVKNFKNVLKEKENKLKYNAIITLLITIVIIGLFALYLFIGLGNEYSTENIFQLIIILLPLSIVIFLIIFSGIKEINK